LMRNNYASDWALIFISPAIFWPYVQSRMFSV
jgi:hypothetical protein